MSLAIVQLGQAGDILVLLPALKWLSTSDQIHLVTSSRFAPLCENLPWLSVHGLDVELNHVGRAIAHARTIAHEVRMTQLAHVPFRPTQRSYQLELWKRARVPVELFDELPLELARDRAAEQKILEFSGFPVR